MRCALSTTDKKKSCRYTIWESTPWVFISCIEYRVLCYCTYNFRGVPVYSYEVLCPVEGSINSNVIFYFHDKNLSIPIYSFKFVQLFVLLLLMLLSISSYFFHIGNNIPDIKNPPPRHSLVPQPRISTSIQAPPLSKYVFFACSFHLSPSRIAHEPPSPFSKALRNVTWHILH
jgi:hypothetical protein